MRTHGVIKIAFVVTASIISAPAMAATYQLTPVDDTYAYSGEPDTAHGSLSGIATGYAYPHSEAGWISYLKFDLGSVPNNEVITGATLNLYKFITGAGYGQLGTNLFRFADDSWTENTLTWSNQPLGFDPYGIPLKGTFIASNPDGFSYVGWSSWNLLEKSAWDPSIDQADGFLSLQLAEIYSGDQSHNWCSKESDPTNCPASAMHQPYLTITTAPVPLPPAVWLFGSGLLGLIGVARRKVRTA
jgi:hypothetical protein